MNATSLDELRQGPAARAVADEKMDQVRELLIGDLMRQTEARMATMDARIRSLEADLGQQIDALRARIDALAGEMTGEHRTAFEDLARGIDELGQRVRRMTRP